MESASKAAGVAPDTQKHQPRQASSELEGSPTAIDSPTPRRPSRRIRLWGALVVLAALTSMLLPIARAGLWDPVEVVVADQARRAAVHVMGARSLAAEGTPDEIPTVEEVGRGELPVLSMAVGLSVFGAHAWAARLMLALWSLAGAAGLFALVARLESVKAGLLSVGVLVTTPLVFANARTALGDAVTMASICLAFALLMLSWADPKPATLRRSSLFLSGCVALGAGFWCRGLLIGVAVPALSVGLTWLLLFRSKHAAAPAQRLAQVFGAAALAVGIVAFGWGLFALYSADPATYSKLVGSTIVDPKQLPTHDVVVHYLGHGMFPWSALLPLSVGALARPTTGTRAALRVGLMLVTAVAIFGYSITISRTGPIAFGAPFALAALCALTLLSLDRADRGVMPAMMAAALLVLLYEDFSNFPEKGLSALVPAAGAAFPEAMQGLGKRYIQVAAALGLVGCVVLVLNRVRWAELVLSLKQSPHRATLLFASVLGMVVGGLRRVWQMGSGVSHRPRALVLGGTMLAGGAILSLGYYPALAAQLSPAGVYEAYQRQAAPDEPLAVMGSGAVKGSVFYAGAAVKNFVAVDAAVDWLEQAPTGRRWLILKSADLARANSHYRAVRKGENLPVLNADSSEILLAAGRLNDGERNVNPFSDVVLSSDPKLRHTPQARWGQELELAGWEIRSEDGRVTDTLRPGGTYQFVTAYRVLNRVTSTWESFIHIDGDGKRINGDHKLLEDKYPTRYWLPGDVIVDRHELKVDPTYGGGEYTVYFGLFLGSKRYSITAGDQKDNRLRAGVVQVAR